MRAIGYVLISIACVSGCVGNTEPFREEQERRALLEGTPQARQLGGTARAVWTEGTRGFSVELVLEGDEPGRRRPWHVHFGTCAMGGGAIVGSDRDYPQLSIGPEGGAMVSTAVPATLTTIELYYVDVHPSEARTGEMIACGDLLDETEGEPAVPLAFRNQSPGAADVGGWNRKGEDREGLGIVRVE